MRVLLFSIVVCLFSAAQAHPYTICDVDGVKPSFVPKGVTITPARVKRGTTATFVIVGKNNVRTNEGDFTVETSRVVGKTAIKLETKTYPLCEHTHCPVKRGRMKLHYERKIPIFAPPGEYRVRVIAKDANDKPILCLQVSFKIYFRQYLPIT